MHWRVVNPPKSGGEAVTGLGGPRNVMAKGRRPRDYMEPRWIRLLGCCGHLAIIYYSTYGICNYFVSDI